MVMKLFLGLLRQFFLVFGELIFPTLQRCGQLQI